MVLPLSVQATATLTLAPALVVLSAFVVLELKDKKLMVLINANMPSGRNISLL